VYTILKCHDPGIQYERAFLSPQSQGLVAAYLTHLQARPALAKISWLLATFGECRLMA
jgi:hypothetical protein